MAKEGKTDAPTMPSLLASVPQYKVYDVVLRSS
jgi:hypothetical protein